MSSCLLSCFSHGFTHGLTDSWGCFHHPPVGASSLDSSLYFVLSITATVVFLVVSDWSEEVVLFLPRRKFRRPCPSKKRGKRTRDGKKKGQRLETKLMPAKLSVLLKEIKKEYGMNDSYVLWFIGQERMGASLRSWNWSTQAEQDWTSDRDAGKWRCEPDLILTPRELEIRNFLMRPRAPLDTIP